MEFDFSNVVVPIGLFFAGYVTKSAFDVRDTRKEILKQPFHQFEQAVDDIIYVYISENLLKDPEKSIHDFFRARKVCFKPERSQKKPSLCL